MKDNSGNKIFGLVIILLLVLANLLHFGFFTIWLILEQIETGMDGGTLMEMGVLYMWMFEFLLIPVFVIGLFYFVNCFVAESYKKYAWVNAVLYIFLALQIILSNLFLYI